MVVRVRKPFGQVLGLALVGSLLGGPAAVGAPAGEDEVGLSTYTYNDIALAPNVAPAGSPVQVHGFVGHGPYSPAAGELVTIYFDPAGTAPREAVATVTTDADGWFAKTVRPSTSGTYDIVRPGEDEDTLLGPGTATFTSRKVTQPVRSVVVSGTKNGHTAKARVIVQDVVTRIEPQTVYVDAGLLTAGYPGNIKFSGPYMTNRRAEGRFGAGDVYYSSGEFPWRTNYSATRAYRLSAVHPAGLYDVRFTGEMAVWTDRWDAEEARVSMPGDVVTTVRVRRASSTTIAASATSFTGPKTITLRGAVRKVQLVSNTKAAIRLSPNTPVKLYFDPAGATGPQYKKTVRTNSKGVYTTTYRTTRSGQWIAKYPGTDLQAPSERAVTITVR
ncbi:hypothetical protein [Promicromonospora sp. MEB111]|uniref:hypothetical protein n=1 Tax=Promicromonospora sp. MEB111 TaxID=3040301 RepID=UPI00254F7F43|nr:hypothetical protein [Promicromonospora sp. MEB111]